VRLVAIFVFLLGLAAGCTPVVNPATGELQHTSMTPAEEAQIGRKEHPRVMAQFGGAYADRALQAYVTRIGNELVAVSELADLDFTFTVLDSEIVNAFALPGGYVYVTRGLIALADNEAELASVLAHEIGHVTARHSAQRYDRAQLGSIAAGVATILGGVLLGDVGAQLGQQVGGLGAAAYVQSYSREQEFEADQLGVRYLGRAGYDPQAMASFLDKLRAKDELARAGRRGGSGVPSFLASHPRAADRVARVAREAGGGTGRTGRDAYLAAIDGLVYGSSPAQGFVRGQTFEHPELRVRFKAPEGFELVNTPSRVIGRDPTGRLLLFDMGKAPRGTDLAGYLQRDWIREQRVRDLQGLDVGGKPAAFASGTVTVNRRSAPALFGVVRGGGDAVWRFMLVNPRGIGQTDLNLLLATMRSVENLSAAEAARLQPERIAIVTVQPGDTVDSLAAQMKVEEHPREIFMLLNGLNRRALRPGDRVKLVR
jgi:predicted Zn-dependent protease